MRDIIITTLFSLVTILYAATIISNKRITTLEHAIDGAVQEKIGLDCGP